MLCVASFVGLVYASFRNYGQYPSTQHKDRPTGKDLKAQNKEMAEIKGRFLDHHTNYDASLADFETTSDQLMAAREKGQKDILDTRSAMKDLMTKEEWTEVFRSNS